MAESGDPPISSLPLLSVISIAPNWSSPEGVNSLAISYKKSVLSSRAVAIVTAQPYYFNSTLEVYSS